MADQEAITFMFSLFKVVYLVTFFLFCLIMSIQESEFFNWKCLIGNVLAKSPLHLENQFLVEHGIYVDIDGTEWVKCVKCLTPYH